MLEPIVAVGFATLVNSVWEYQNNTFEYLVNPSSQSNELISERYITAISNLTLALVMITGAHIINTLSSYEYSKMGLHLSIWFGAYGIGNMIILTISKIITKR